MSKYPNCNCGTTRFDYLRKRYKNGTLHLVRRCATCKAIAQNAMRQEDYCKRWVESLEVIDKGVTSEPVQNANPVQTAKPMRTPKTGYRPNPVQNRADQIHEKLKRHIQSRTL